ncbi:MAG: UbiA family prenyltransferase [Candidatus Thermoplasmatota archaeon]|nr:UbiA family prenyltransferase [Candidatus Thermoplasmatota archaeon]
MMDFLKAYLRSTRPYTFFITGTAGLCGIMVVGGDADLTRVIVSLFLLFSAYGVNQVVNDLMGTREDRMNKVSRPSVTGELDRRKAWMMTGLLFVVGGVITSFLNPYALMVYVAGYAFNVIYEELKGIPLIGNLWFGAMISLAPIYGAMTTGDLSPSDVLKEEGLLFLVLLIAVLQSNMCYFTYFKDARGDAKAGKRTLVVLLGPARARYINFIIFPIPFVLISVLVLTDVLRNGPGPVSILFLALSFILYLILSVRLMKDPTSRRGPLELDFQGAVLFQNGLIAMYHPVLGTILGIVSFIIIMLIFRIMYRRGFYG